MSGRDRDDQKRERATPIWSGNGEVCAAAPPDAIDEREKCPACRLEWWLHRRPETEGACTS